jgi:N4-gp56 family major capsid protein
MADTLTGVTETVATAVDVISTLAQSYLQEASKFSSLLDDYSSQVQPGSKSVEIPRAGGFTVGTKAENTAADATSVTWATDAIDLDQHKYVQWLIEDIASAQSVLSINEQNVMRAAKDMAAAKDLFLVNLLETASASTPDHRIAYAATTTIAEADILDARELLIVQNIDPSELVLAVSPAQESVMLQLSNFIDASKYGSAGATSNGEIGRVFGARVIVSNNVEDLKSILFHKSAVGHASQFGPRFQTQPDLANLGTRYSMDHLYGGKLMDTGKRCVMIGTAA